MLYSSDVPVNSSAMTSSCRAQFQRTQVHFIFDAVMTGRTLDATLLADLKLGSRQRRRTRTVRSRESASQRIDRSGRALRNSRPGVRQVGLSRSWGRQRQQRRPRQRRAGGDAEVESSNEEWKPSGDEDEEVSDVKVSVGCEDEDL